MRSLCRLDVYGTSSIYFSHVCRIFYLVSSSLETMLADFQHLAPSLGNVLAVRAASCSENCTYFWLFIADCILFILDTFVQA